MSLKVSVIVPAYNSGQFITQTLDSVLSQTYTNWELIVVDDESTDNTRDIVTEYAALDSRVKYIWQKNGRQGKARNRAIAESTGEYLAFLDSDDVWMPDKLEKQLTLLNKYNIDLVFGYSYILDKGVLTNRMIGRGLGMYRQELAIEFLLLHDAFIMSTVIVKREAFLMVGCFSEDLRFQYCEDWHAWLKLAFAGSSFYTDATVVSAYRHHEDSATFTETRANIKFFYALLDLRKRVDNAMLNRELHRRGLDLVKHSVELDDSLVGPIIEVTHQRIFFKLSVLIYKMLFKLNVAMFRKVVLALH